MGADWEVTWMDIIVVAVKGEDGDGGYDGDVVTHTLVQHLGLTF